MEISRPPANAHPGGSHSRPPMAAVVRASPAAVIVGCGAAVDLVLDASADRALAVGVVVVVELVEVVVAVLGDAQIIRLAHNLIHRELVHEVI